MKKKPKILVTRPLDDHQIELAEKLELDLIVEPAIQIEHRTDWFAIKTQLKAVQKPVLAFTSQNGVEAFELFLETGFEIPKSTPVYAVGNKTAEALRKLGLDAKTPGQQDGAGLAKIITDDFLNNSGLKDASVLHFCGDKRRDEFRQYLQDSGIKTRNMVVYNTLLNTMTIPDQNVDGVLFYSPSAVHAFRNSGGFVKQTQTEFFAIGTTTAEELSIESGKHVHISPEPDTDIFLTFVAKVLAGNET